MQLSSELAWREGAIVFDGEPLSEAIAEIERYTDARIIITDAHTAALPVGGRFRTDDMQGFFDGLQARAQAGRHPSHARRTRLRRSPSLRSNRGHHWVPRVAVFPSPAVYS